MAVYKVPQDVEADDKLIGPFSFRQFIYLIIVAASIAIGWGLSKILLPLALIPAPVILLFGALALPLRKDQPMETYLSAMVSFYLKPRRRIWDPDGQDTLIEITALKTVEVQRTKDLSESEAERRLSYLANIVDSQGWAVRGIAGPTPANSAMNADMYYEAQQAEDVLDTSGHTAIMIGDQLQQSNERYHQQLMARMQAPQPAPQAPVVVQPIITPMPAVPVQPQVAVYVAPQAPAPPTPEPVADDPSLHMVINPYPNMNQSVIQPLSEPASPTLATNSTQTVLQTSPTQILTPPEPVPAKQTEIPSVKTVSPDIISLANNSDLSIETIAHEAKRIKEKESLSEDEVVISLR